MDLLSLGVIINTHGLDGTVVISSSTDFGDERYKDQNKIILINPYNKEQKILTSKSYRRYKGMDYVSFYEIENIDEASKLKGYEVCIEKENATLPEGYYHFSDLEKCEVYDENDNLVGHVVKVEDFPAQVTLRCTSLKNKEFMVPFIHDVFVLDVDIENKKIKVKIIGGML